MAIRINHEDFIVRDSDALRQLLVPEPGRRFLFHGTFISSATNIINRGVRLQNGNPRQDFSVSDNRGYYVTTHLQMAMDRAYATQRQDELFCAVVVHDLPIDLPSSFSGVTDQWPESIQALAPHYISGNICANPQHLFLRPPTDSLDRGVTHFQLCVVRAELAQAFTQAITRVVYIFSA